MRLLIFVLLFCTSAATAHIRDGAQTRDIVLAMDGDVVQLFVRVPLPLVFTDVIVAAQTEQSPLQSPFLYPEQTSGGIRYRLDLQAIADNSAQFEARLAQNLRLLQAESQVAAELVRYRFTTHHPDLPFDSAAAARAALAESSTELDPVFGQAFVEYELRLAARVDHVQSAAPPLTLPDGISIENTLVLATRWFVRQVSHGGQLVEPAAFPRFSVTWVWPLFAVVLVLAAAAVVLGNRLFRRLRSNLN